MNLDKEITNWLKQFFPGWTYNKPIDFCPRMGPQVVEQMYAELKGYDDRGFCASWSIMFIHYRIMNPSFTDKQLIERLMNRASGQLFSEIRRYTSYFVKKIN